MNFRSVADLNQCLVHNIHRLPAGLDLVVGVPRSGLLVANLLALHLNLPVTDVDGLIARRLLSVGRRLRERATPDLRERCRVLLLDDSVRSGEQMAKVRSAIGQADLPHEITYAAVYATPQGIPHVDIHLEICPDLRVFEWNMMHHILLERACVDIDGVLCHDPTERQNDDGRAYVRFLREARSLPRPTVTIDRLVTCRLEKYRELTEQWLAAHHIRYKQLIMLDLPNKAARVAAGSHGRFKGEVYRDSDTVLFIESSLRQALEIAGIAGKPVLCTETGQMLYPNAAALLRRAARRIDRTIARRSRLAFSRIGRHLTRLAG